MGQHPPFMTPGDEPETAILRGRFLEGIQKLTWSRSHSGLLNASS